MALHPKKKKKTKSKKISRFDLANGNLDGTRRPLKCPTIKPKGTSNMKVATRGRKRTVAKINAKSEILPGKIILDIPIKTVSEANCFEPWQKKHGRHKDQQRQVAIALVPHKENVKLPCSIMLTRFAPDSLDVFDNLPMSFKYIVDAVCAIITGEYRAGKADSDKRISIACGQEKNDAYGVRIEITNTQDDLVN